MKSLWLATAAIVIALPAIPAAHAQVVGIVSAVRNDVRIRKPNGPVPLPAQLKQRIALADMVQTGAKSQLQLMLLDKSVFTIGANARLTIDRFVYDPARNNRSLGATVGKGTFRFMSGRRTTGSTQINTPTASIGVRGTMLDGVVGEEAVLIANGERGVGRGVRADPNGATLVVLRGPGAGTRANVNPGVIDVTSGGRTVSAGRPMQAIYVPHPGAPPIGPFTISPEGLRQIQAMLHPSLAQHLGWQGPVDPGRTFTEAPDFGEPGGGPRGFPRGPRGPGFDPQGGDDGPPGATVPLPLDRLRDVPPPQPRRTPTPTQTPAPTPNAGPQNRTTPAPQPTPPPPVLQDNAPQPSPSPTPRPSPTPTPAPKQPGPNDPGYKPPR